MASNNNRPTYYLWKSKDLPRDDAELIKQKWIDRGFRVVVFVEGYEKEDASLGIKRVINNHID